MMKTFKFSSLPATKQTLVANVSQLHRQNNSEKLFRGDVLRDLQLGISSKPDDEKDREAWLDRISSDVPLDDPKEEEARQIAKQIMATYSQDHTYIIPRLFSEHNSDVAGQLLFESDPINTPEGHTSKKRYYHAEDGNLMFEHSITVLTITSSIDMNLSLNKSVPMTIMQHTQIYLPTTITVTMKVSDPIDSLEIKIGNDIPLSSEKGLVETIITNEAPQVGRQVGRLFAEKHFPNELNELTKNEYVAMIDGYIKHVQSADYSEEDKEQKLEIACQAKANLTGEAVETGTTIGVTIAPTLPNNAYLPERIKSFQQTIIENENTLNKNLHGEFATAFGRFCKKVKATLTKAFTKEDTPKAPPLNVGWFGSHGQALVNKMKRDAELMAIATTPTNPSCGG